MATLLLTAVGTLVGGPIGGAIGALAGREIDALVFKPGAVEGPRLTELAVSTSSYGMPIARHYGRMRVAGSIIWATDLVEHRESHGGGKGKPSTTTYSYTASLAVALSSRPIAGIGRIWADGQLLRGAGSDLKVGGAMRLYTGRGDQPRDPLISAAEGAGRCPAFRDLAYVVFENLALADFGNRIPALSFEIFADSAGIALGDLAGDLIEDFAAPLPLTGLAGFSQEGSAADSLAMLGPLYPLIVDVSGEEMVVSADPLGAVPLDLPDAALAEGEGEFGGKVGYVGQREAASDPAPAVLRYYDSERDYQPGAQRAPGRPAPGQPRTLELPATLTAADARRLIGDAALSAARARQTLTWRIAQLDPALVPGRLVVVPGQPGTWRVASWEWRAHGVELKLVRHAQPGPVPAIADPGRVNSPVDLPAAPTALVAFDLPWDGTGSAATPLRFAALSSPSPGWKGAALYCDRGDGALIELGPSGRARATIGSAVSALGPASPLLFDRTNSVDVLLVGEDLSLAPATMHDLAMGANRALLGEELMQFADAVALGGGRWRLSGLWRGRGGREAAIAGHLAGEPFVLLDGGAVALDPQAIGEVPGTEIAALGLFDPVPVASPILLAGITLQPLSPVHGRVYVDTAGTATLAWTRRARGAWQWLDGAATPLNEQGELYSVELTSAGAVLARWETTQPWLTLAAAELAPLLDAASAPTFLIRQHGDHGASPALAVPLP